MFLNIFKYSFQVLLAAGFIACSGATQQAPKATPIHNKAGAEASIFKAWLTDTLKVLMNSKLNGYPKVIYKVAEDSMQLDIYEHYKFVYDKNYKKEKADGVEMVSLLKEYAEMPPLHSIISYNAHTTYYPSAVEQLRAAFVFEVEHFLVETKDELIEYGYIRGRLSDKIVKDKKNGSRRACYSFIWDENNNLSKVEM